ncbi:MAG: SRPBCC family protein [Actinobacteria bacterium]|nr:SRPBCC family protein [Actinomycetota bacterium]
MGSIRVAIDINASTQRVWDVVEPIERHVDWMADAVAIRFKTDQTRGTGTEFFCDTKVGPITLVDEMTITSWVPQKAMGVTHTGVVTGTGEFTLEALTSDTTRFVWTEVLVFPWWLGGKLGSLVGGQIVMKAIWRKNLRILKRLAEQ